MELIIDNLSKTYSKGIKALHNISLETPTGMLVCLDQKALKNRHLCEPFRHYKKLTVVQFSLER